MEKKEAGKGKESQIVVFRAGAEEFGADIGSVLEISRVPDITRLPEAPGFVEGVMNLRGQVIAVIDFARQFGMPHPAQMPKTARVIVAQAGQEKFGLKVEAVPEVLRIMEDMIEPTPEIIRVRLKGDYLKGIVKVGERLIILVDLEKVLAPEQVEEMGQIQKTDQGGKGGHYGEHTACG